METTAPFVWIDEEGSGRNVHAYFRRDFVLSQSPESAELHIYAHDRYLLYVNGMFVNYGPARAYNHRPHYDSYDLAGLLHEGSNCIAVHVAGWGVNDFHTQRGPAALAAWGEVSCSDGTRLCLSTADGWTARRAGGFDPMAPKYSFAQPLIHVYDAREDICGWNLPQTDTSGWPPAVALSDQNAYGRMQRRSIPPLTSHELTPHHLCGAFSLRSDEQIISFRVPGLDPSEDRGGDYGRIFAFTHIYSPSKQQVPVHVIWGEHFVNGEELERSPDAGGRHFCEDMLMPLREGWNTYFITYGVSFGSWDFIIGFPPDAGLVFSPEKDMDSDVKFLTAGPMPSAAAEGVAIPLASPSHLPASLCLDWKAQRNEVPMANPAIDMVWSDTERDNSYEASEAGGLTASHPDGSAFVFDMGATTLGRVFVEFEAPAGAVIDTGTAESLSPQGRPNILKRSGLFAVERHIAAGGGPERMECFEPRGFRYLQVNVKGSSSPVKLQRVGVVEQIYPYSEDGRFECSDPLLNDVWEIGWRALRMCSEDVYTDCPSRERAFYGGDFFVEMAVSMAGSSDLRLIKRCIQLCLDHPNKPSEFVASRVPRPLQSGSAPKDFALLVLLAWDWYVRRSGDMDFAERHYEGFKRLVNLFLAMKNSDGLIEASRPFIRHKKFDRGACNTAIHALLLGALEAVERTAGSLGYNEEADRYGRERGTLQECASRTFFDPVRGVFSDGIRDGMRLPGSEPVTNAMAVLFNLSTPQQRDKILLSMEEQLQRADAGEQEEMLSPYSSFYILGALYRMELEEVAELLIHRYWGSMVLRGAATTWEHFEPRSSLCHAWGAAPTYYLTTHALGVRLGFPGNDCLREVLIAPQSDTLSWARGVVQHRMGSIGVDWRIKGKRLYVEYSAPSGTPVRVEPRGRMKELELYINGRRAAGESEADIQ